MGVMGGIPDHDGEIPDEPFDFFFPPPPEVGKLISARSSPVVGGPSPSRAVYLMVAALYTCAAFAIFLVFALLQGDDTYRNFFMAIAVILAAVVFILVLVFGGFRASCSYVGADGVAMGTVRRKRSNRPKIQLLVFNNAADLQTRQVRQVDHGLYSGTHYRYIWRGFDGAIIIRLMGVFRAKEGALPNSSSTYHLARAAELAWTQHLLDRAEHCLKEEGSIPFEVDSHRLVRIGPGFIEFHFGGEPVRVTKDDIAKVTLSDGTFAFQHKDTKWFSSAGKYSFQYGQMANARFFLMALDKLMGYRWN